MKNAFNIAMELSNGTFAYYLCGVLNTLSDNGDKAPVPNEEAAEYLDTFHEGWRDVEAEAEAQEEEKDTRCFDEFEPREDFGYFGEMGMMED